MDREAVEFTIKMDAFAVSAVQLVLHKIFDSLAERLNLFVMGLSLPFKARSIRSFKQTAESLNDQLSVHLKC